MIKPLFVVYLLLILSGCHNNNNDQAQVKKLPRTPVEVTTVHKGVISNKITLFGNTVYLKRNVVTAPIPAFITGVHVKLGDKVNKGDVLYDLETKEKRALGEQPLTKDTTLTNFGKIIVKASFSGIITTLDKQQIGDYVLEGAQLCTIAESDNLSVQVMVPFEYTVYTRPGKVCTIRLPDGRDVAATITTPLTTMNAIAQTQTILAKPNGTLFLPENLIVKVVVTISNETSATLLPRAAVLTDEMEQQYWVMKMVSDTIAIKVPVTTGEKSSEEIEIRSPDFQTSDRIVIVGNYGLPDTARVVIEKKQP